MDIRGGIARWAGWRRYGPAAAAVAVNLALLAAFSGLMAADGKPRASPSARTIVVELVPDILPPPPSVRQPPDADKRRSDTSPKALPPLGRQMDETVRRQEVSPLSDYEGDSVYLGPAPLAEGEVPRGFAGLLGTDPCAETADRMRNDCKLQWAKLMDSPDALMPPTLEELAEMYPGFQPPLGLMCSRRLGCTRTDKEWISLNGTRSFGLKSPMASGPGSLGGLHDMVGRLAPPNPYHVDPGFGD